MAVNIFDKYGIKQVANVYFEALATDSSAGVYEGDIEFQGYNAAKIAQVERLVRGAS